MPKRYSKRTRRLTRALLAAAETGLRQVLAGEQLGPAELDNLFGVEAKVPPVQLSKSRPVPTLTADEEAFLARITTSRQFTLDLVVALHEPKIEDNK